jgi:membrane fusion protein (multidrug efflux system)
MSFDESGRPSAAPPGVEDHTVAEHATEKATEHLSAPASSAPASSAPASSAPASSARAFGARDDNTSEGGNDRSVGGETKSGDSKGDDSKGDDSKSDDSKSDDSKGGDAKSAGNAGGSERRRSKKPLVIVAIIVIVLAIVALIVWFAHRNQVSTDDAYTDGNTVTMAPKVAGYVVELLIDDNTHVHRGDLLLRIDPRDFQAAKAQAEAQLALAQAELKAAQNALDIAKVQYPAQYQAAVAQRQSAAAQLSQAAAEYKRQHEVDRRATTQESIDISTSQELSTASSLKSAQAQVAIAALVPQQIEQAATLVVQREAEIRQAQAQLDQANLNLGYTEIRAPVDGVVTMRSVQLGTYVRAGDSMFLLVTPEVWVTANFKESQIGRMRIGDKVDLEIDAYSSLHLKGHIQSIQYGSGSKFSAFPAENATGNFVKIVQRVPVKIVIDSGLDPNRELPLGLSVDPVVYFP